MNQTNDLTQGKVTPVFLRFFFPMLMTNLLQQFYTFVDTAIVGKGLGDHALAAVGNMSALTFLIIGFAQGITTGFTVVFARHFGSKNYSSLRKSIATSVSLSAVLSAVLTALSLVFLKDILVLIRTDEAIFQGSLIYGSIIFGGMTATIAYNLCSSILRALGDSKTPFLAIVISSVVNIALDCLFIFGFKTGVGGAAVATLLAQIISVLICFVRLSKIDDLRLTREDFFNNRAMILNLLKNGVPMACMNSITAVGCTIVQSYVNMLGVIYTSAYSACSKYLNLFMIPFITAGFAVSAFTSQNHGAGKYDRIISGVKVGLMIGIVSYLTLGLGMALFAEPLLKLLLNGRETIEPSVRFLRFCGVMYFTLHFLFIFRNAVQGVGKPLVPMLSGFAEMVMRIVIIVFLLPRIGFMATAYAEVGAWTSALIMNFIAYLYLIPYRHKKKTAV